MTIEVGKWYRTRSGRKAFVAARMNGAYPFYGHVELGGDERLEIWSEAGCCDINGSESPLDLIAPLASSPTIDWSKEREWVKAIAMDKDGSWWRYSSPPAARDASWVTGGFFHQLHPTEYPTNPDGTPWTGDWKNSLIVRPEGGAR